MNKRYLAPKELAEMFGVTRDTVLDWIRRGVLKPMRLSRRTLRFDPDEVERALRNDTGVARPASSGQSPVAPERNPS